MRDTLGLIERELEAIRADRRLQGTLMGAGVLVGLALALVHWIGFVLAGVVIGLAARTLGQAVVVALLASGLAITAFLAHAWWFDQLAVFLSFGRLAVVAVVIPVGLTVFGALVRAVT